MNTELCECSFHNPTTCSSFACFPNNDKTHNIMYTNAFYIAESKQSILGNKHNHQSIFIVNWRTTCSSYTIYVAI